jgi:hypothetical protein
MQSAVKPSEGPSAMQGDKRGLTAEELGILCQLAADDGRPVETPASTLSKRTLNCLVDYGMVTAYTWDLDERARLTILGKATVDDALIAVEGLQATRKELRESEQRAEKLVETLAEVTRDRDRLKKAEDEWSAQENWYVSWTVLSVKFNEAQAELKDAQDRLNAACVVNRDLEVKAAEFDEANATMRRRITAFRSDAQAYRFLVEDHEIPEGSVGSYIRDLKAQLRTLRASRVPDGWDQIDAEKYRQVLSVHGIQSGAVTARIRVLERHLTEANARNQYMAKRCDTLTDQLLSAESSETGIDASQYRAVLKEFGIEGGEATTYIRDLKQRLEMSSQAHRGMSARVDELADRLNVARKKASANASDAEAYRIVKSRFGIGPGKSVEGFIEDKNSQVAANRDEAEAYQSVRQTHGLLGTYGVSAYIQDLKERITELTQQLVDEKSKRMPQVFGEDGSMCWVKLKTAERKLDELREIHCSAGTVLSTWNGKETEDD